jgi:hypothetical protein
VPQWSAPGSPSSIFAATLVCPIVVPVGSWITAARVHVHKLTGTAGAIKVRLRKISGLAATAMSNEVSSTGTPSFQAVILTGITPAATVATENWFLTIEHATADSKFVVGAEVTYDRR